MNCLARIEGMQRQATVAQERIGSRINPGDRSKKMPLHDAFKKKPVQPSASQPPDRSSPLVKMAHTPSLEDLRFAMLTAEGRRGQPVLLTWKKSDRAPTCLLSVTIGTDAIDPTWVFHVGDDENTQLSWIYTTIDPELIYSLLVEAVAEQGPKAVIPDSLRPPKAEIAPAPLSKPAEPAQALVAEPALPVARVEEPGSVFSERYEIISSIGSGGMGMIYKARHRQNGQLFALKVLHPHLLVNANNRKRFEQEAAAARGLSHRNLLAVHEFGFSTFGQPFLAMDYLEGRSLDSVLAEVKRLDEHSFINIFTQICDGLTYAHSKGVIHRDIKPSNVMLLKSERGVDTVKIIDFGIAKLAREGSGEHLTTTGDVLGSPAYMSPEQCGGTELDARSDIYSLGCVMYEAIAGVLPFEHKSAIRTILMQVSDPPTPFSALCPDLNIPEEIERIIFKALEKEPDMRYQAAHELGIDLWAATMTASSPAAVKPGCKDLFTVLNAPPKVERETEESLPAAKQTTGKQARITREPKVSRSDKISLEKIFDLLKKSGLVSQMDMEAVLECQDLIKRGRMTMEQAVATIQLCHRNVMSFHEVAAELGLDID